MVHVSGKLDGILGALNLETSFIHHTVICHILNKFDVIRHSTFGFVFRTWPQVYCNQPQRQHVGNGADDATIMLSSLFYLHVFSSFSGYNHEKRIYPPEK